MFRCVIRMERPIDGKMTQMHLCTAVEYLTWLYQPIDPQNGIKGKRHEHMVERRDESKPDVHEKI